MRPWVSSSHFHPRTLPPPPVPIAPLRSRHARQCPWMRAACLLKSAEDYDVSVEKLGNLTTLLAGFLQVLFRCPCDAFTAHS